jgi:hypothetical protein
MSGCALSLAVSHTVPPRARDAHHQATCAPAAAAAAAAVRTCAQLKEGSWYPAGLNAYSDMRGLAGYKICLSVALLLGEGCFVMVKATLLGEGAQCRAWSSFQGFWGGGAGLLNTARTAC